MRETWSNRYIYIYIHIFLEWHFCIDYWARLLVWNKHPPKLASCKFSSCKRRFWHNRLRRELDQTRWERYNMSQCMIRKGSFMAISHNSVSHAAKELITQMKLPDERLGSYCRAYFCCPGLEFAQWKRASTTLTFLHVDWCGNDLLDCFLLLILKIVDEIL